MASSMEKPIAKQVHAPNVFALHDPQKMDSLLHIEAIYGSEKFHD